jgi:hypothetical protein
MDMPSSIFPALGSILAALIAAAVAFLSTVLSKEQKTSEFRQVWVDALRADISELIGFIETFASYLHFVHDRHGVEQAKDFVEGHTDQVTKATVLYHRIRLRLNPMEHVALLSALKGAFSVFSNGPGYMNSSAVEQAIESVLVESQAVLKSEWSRVKRGEAAFRATKYLSLAVVVIALILIALLLNRHLPLI